MRQEHVRWYSPRLGRDMDLLMFGHAGARVVVFPTSMGSYVEYRDRGMIDALGHHIAQGWLQVTCVDSADADSWYADHLPPPARVANHLRYEQYLFEEVLPFTEYRNDNPYVIFTGCSFGAFHAVLHAFRHPDRVNRVVALSGAFRPGRWLNGYMSDEVYFLDPVAFVGGIRNPAQRATMNALDITLAVGRDDPLYDSNVELAGSLTTAGVHHTLRVYDGWAHDWPYWQGMILDHIGGPNSR